MREIKFRAWDKENNIMTYFDLLDLAQISDIQKIILVNDIVIQQFTGLKDKNGVEIYEGDIIIWTTGEKAEVIWSDGDAEFFGENTLASFGGFETKPCLNGLDGIRSKYYEVIGNIHDNPELLTN